MRVWQRLFYVSDFICCWVIPYVGIYFLFGCIPWAWWHGYLRCLWYSAVMFYFLLKFYACLLWIIRRRDVYFWIIYYNCVIYRLFRNRALHKWCGIVCSCLRCVLYSLLGCFISHDVFYFYITGSGFMSCPVLCTFYLNLFYLKRCISFCKSSCCQFVYLIIDSNDITILIREN